MQHTTVSHAAPHCKGKGSSSTVGCLQWSSQLRDYDAFGRDVAVAAPRAERVELVEEHDARRRRAPALEHLR